MKTIRPSDQDLGAKATTPSPMDRKGERESDVEGAKDMAYGEPRGPRPPRFTTRPKAEIDDRARAHTAARADDRYAVRERAVDGFHSGMTTPETLQTTGDQSPRAIRPPEDRESDDGDDRGS